MTFHIITIFPEIIRPYFSKGVIGMGREKGLFDLKIYNLREFTTDKHRKVDDTPYGGGPGMVMKVEPIFNCIQAIKDSLAKKEKSLVILTSARGKVFNQKKAKKLVDKYQHLIFICGRYEGVDQRVAEFVADKEFSIGKYVLSGGELAALVMTDVCARLIEGVLGNEESLISESYNQEEFDYPVYTKPEQFKNWLVPKVLLGGNHGEIKKWRDKHRAQKN